jgi:hypothetical protein
MRAIAVLLVAAFGCPQFAVPECFSEPDFPCGVCCNDGPVPTGDGKCWRDQLQFAPCCGVTYERLLIVEQYGFNLPEPAKGPTACPPAANAACFDQHFTCERCCDTRHGAQGFHPCWRRRLSYEFCCGILPFSVDVNMTPLELEAA